MIFALVLPCGCEAAVVPSAVPVESMIPGVSGCQATDAESNGLTVRMDVDRVNEVPTIEYDKPFRVVLTNNSQHPLKICSPETLAGYFQLSFQFTNPANGEKLVARKRQVENSAFWKMLAGNIQPEREFVEIASSKSYTIDADLSAVCWDKQTWTSLPDPSSSTRFLVTAQFESSNAATKDGQTIWIGKCESDAISVHLVAENLSTPNDYLRRGIPAAAIRLMKDDLNMINAADTFDGTPLHTAAKYGDIDTVQRLLDHGADVSSVGYSGFTPLHLTGHPGVVELILRYEPDLSIHSRNSGPTPLQKAAREYAESHDPLQKGKWKEIIDLYLSAGAEYDAITAICRDDVDRLGAILSKSPQIADDFEGHSLLRLAASLGCVESCRYLTDNFRVDVDDFKRGNGYPIIMEAVAFPVIMKLLIAHGADLDTRITWQAGNSGIQIIGDNATILHYAADTGVPETITMLIDSGVDLFATDRDSSLKNQKQTALEIVAVFGKGANAEAIIKHPKFTAAPPEIRQSLLDKCLLIGASSSWDVRDSQRLKLIRVLVEAGADPNVMKDGLTPMLSAVSRIHPSSWVENAEIKRIVAYLIERGATVDFFSAVAIGDSDRVRQLLETNPGLASTRRPDGYPVLHFAVGMDDMEIVSALLKAGCDVNIRNKSDHTGSVDETALHNAAFWGRDEIALLLIEAGADVNALDEHHTTPLDEARRLGNKNVEDLLLLLRGATSGTGD